MGVQKAWVTGNGGAGVWAYVPARVVGTLAQCWLRGRSAWVEGDACGDEGVGLSQGEEEQQVKRAHCDVVHLLCWMGTLARDRSVMWGSMEVCCCPHRVTVSD